MKLKHLKQNSFRGGGSNKNNHAIWITQSIKHKRSVDNFKQYLKENYNDIANKSVYKSLYSQQVFIRLTTKQLADNTKLYNTLKTLLPYKHFCKVDINTLATVTDKQRYINNLL